MKVYTFDTRVFNNWITILLVLLLTVIIGYTNQTDIYQKLNSLPENRTELLPFKEYNLTQQGQTNKFNWYFRFQCALDVTRANILRSMKIGIQNKYFKYTIPLKIQDNRSNAYNGEIFTHFYGRLNMSFMYMFEPLIEEEYNLSMTGYYFTNTLLNVLDDELETLKFNRICFKNGSLHTFSQSTLVNYREVSSFNYQNVRFNSIVDHNYKDFIKRNNGTYEINKARLFFAKKYTKYDQYLKDIISPMHQINSIAGKMMNIFYVNDKQLYTPFDAQESMVYINPEDSVCFDELHIIQPKITTTLENFTTTASVNGTVHDLVILNSTGVLNYSQIFIDALNTSDIEYVQTNTSFNETVSILSNAKFVLVPSSWNEQYLLHFIRGTIMYVAPTPHLQFKVQRNNTKYIQFERSGSYEITPENVKKAISETEKCDVVFAYLKDIIKCV
ncbi:hypothetical protein TVAG_061990 [Trichomonas vaginalis G3]|uniref:Uncharacterized protein n=1 Tax=Trichomonas vaginalis (strain ATCC PRA-98 / G3) TaxID=412133 RepID=A2E7W4_TRIV3|nr:hypothetical protein TVAGG3_0282500 [Trichomonas vaginalis G3]EAY11295.1 hypothetical protein TVAG_061990 [Trichomonas vaginalis G3]KAI5526663.1 hypothetical protein TVAGG3_0282500 [Trichomonas vaginalis G3]|eukprot:XP_001323518.1 hypothetical protein [Trichomonas vaginalis G3]